MIIQIIKVCLPLQSTTIFILKKIMDLLLSKDRDISSFVGTKHSYLKGK
jgi:hypothetical protein|tara:strand:+ start:161 stop:307 length:147 start_codon:yes stop_codon:yes gene_type:complete